MSAPAQGREIDYVVTFLEMTERPARPRPHPPALDAPLSLIRVERPPAGYFRYLYKAVGADYEWTGQDALSDAELAEFVQNPQLRLYTPLLGGVPSGLAMLDFREAGICDLAYFGLAPQALGRGLGRWLLGEATHMGWDAGIRTMTVQTCTLDHPRALATYQKWGFAPVRRETRRRAVSADFLRRRPDIAAQTD